MPRWVLAISVLSAIAMAVLALRLADSIAMAGAAVALLTAALHLVFSHRSRPDA
jgi:lipid-A-disaccharide synthase-like uncharacterized protein